MTSAALRSLASNAQIIGRYATGLPSFLRTPLSPDEARRRVKQQRDQRERIFLRILERAVFARPESPYARLFRHADMNLSSVSSLVRDRGLEPALVELHEAGVRLSHMEFKGLRPIERGGLSFEVGTREFDNPIAITAYATQTGGSRSTGRRIAVDFDMLTHEAAYQRLFLESVGATDRPLASWRAVPPAGAGVKYILRCAKIGHPVSRWFTPSRWAPRESCVHFAFTAYSVAASRLVRRPIPSPEYVPLPRATEIARWLSEQRELGTPALLDAPASSAVRVCQAALERELPIQGSLFLVGGEPFTETRAEILRRAGARGLNRYSMNEIGNIGMPCAEPRGVDDVHVMTDKVAVLRCETAVGRRHIGELFFTTLHPASPKLLINVGSGDYADLEERDCACLLGKLGFRTVLRNIRSYEKLTSEGMTFEGERVMQILDELLPARFGGAPTDYQFVEEEDEGIARVTLVVSPRVGALDDAAVIEAVLDALGEGGHAKQLGANHWRQGETLRLIRAEPHATAAGKILALHVQPR